ncbi:MAG TPA: DUF2782 domain-containing protein [Burkholderiaceae bacterium]|nr:DUF2782 domain-containing protein [Burkholderiaceae bacterium]
MNASFARVRLYSRLPRMLCLAACLCVSAYAGAQAQQQPAQPTAPKGAPANADQVAAAEPRDRAEPNVKRTVIEDEGSKIEELRVRGQAQRIVVTPKVGTTKSYEIITDSSAREMYDGSRASRGAVGQRVWNVLTF